MEHSPKILIEPKLRINKPGDQYDQKADAIADRVMGMAHISPSTKSISGLIGASVQRKCASCKEEEKEKGLVMRKANQSVTGATVSASLGAMLTTSNNHGSPLPQGTRNFMESALSTDFSAVRLHTDNRAAEMSKSINAKAFTYGNDIYFSTGMFSPYTREGRHLLSHELAHVVQQKSSSLSFLIQRVQLTYDDGPDSAGNTRAVLNALRAAQVHATFYLVGRRVVQGDNWRLVFDIAANGNWLGNHAYDWNDATDDHIFLHGTTEERVQKILQTEWAIRDALIRGKTEAQQNNTWNNIPQVSRDYIDDVIAHGTGRFRTPSFRSHIFHRGASLTSEGALTAAAITSANQVLAASGLRTLERTFDGTLGEEGVDVDPHDYTPGRTAQGIESSVASDLDENSDSILLHSRIAATVVATPGIIRNIQTHQWSFDATPQGALGAIYVRTGFAGLQTISNPPTHTEIVTARAFLRNNLSLGPYVSGSIAIGIFQMAQRAGGAEVDDFIAEIRSTSVQTPPTGAVPLAGWMAANPEWSLFLGFYENWRTRQPFPRTRGVTI